MSYRLILALTIVLFVTIANCQNSCSSNLCSNGKKHNACGNHGMSYKVKPLPNSYAEHGEGPHWDVATQSLYYVDVEAGKLMRHDYQENKVYGSKIVGEELASFIIPIEGKSDKFAVGCGRRVLIVSWDGKAESCNVESTLFEVQTDPKFDVVRFNDAKCDPRGRLFAGTMKYIGGELSERLGELYKYEGGKVELVKTDVGISNGLAWNEARKKFYFIDTADYDVKEYDYDFEKGVVVSNPNIVYSFRKSNPKDNLFPDGMTIDTDGNIYVATYNGHTVFKVNPRTSQVLLEINFPCKQITSAAWGGPNLDILYVTTSARSGEPAPCGTTFKVTGLCAKGLPMTKMQL